jgi:hypothetical protein
MALPLSVVVPATNRPHTLEACVAAVRVAMADDDELIVVTDPPDPERRGLASEAAAARNAGAARAQHEILVFVDADIAIHDDALVRIREAFARDDTLVALTGSYDDRAPARNLISQYRNLALYYSHREETRPWMFWNGIGAVRRDTFEQLGRFDTEFMPQLNDIQDLDFGRKLVAAGMRVVADKAIQGTHLKRWTLSGLLRAQLARQLVGSSMALQDGAQPASPPDDVRENSGPASALPLLGHAAALTTAVALAAHKPRLLLFSAGSIAARNHRLLRFLANRAPATAVVAIPLLSAEQLIETAALAAVLLRPPDPDDRVTVSDRARP